MARLTVLGRYGGFPPPGGACSGYLVETDSTSIVCDLGSGALARLNGILPAHRLSGLLLSHLHFDHCSDVLVLQYQLEGAMKAGDLLNPLPLYAPQSPAEVYGQLKKSDAFSVHSLLDREVVEIGDISISIHRVRHGDMEAYAFDLTFPGGKRLFYTGDTGWFAGLAELVGGADVLLCDTAFLAARDQGLPLPHLTTRQAAKLAREGQVKMLLCTHLPAFSTVYGDMEKEIDFPCASVVQELRQYVI